MKKLGKLSISPEKIMKNEELTNLQGGYDTMCCHCYLSDMYWVSWMLTATEETCHSLCHEAYHLDPLSGGMWKC